MFSWSFKSRLSVGSQVSFGQVFSPLCVCVCVRVREGVFESEPQLSVFDLAS